MSTWVPNICLLLAVLVAAVGAWTDFRTGHIPHWLTLPPIALGIVLHGLAAESFVLGALGAVTGAFVCALVPWLLFRKGALGGGDVKLFAAIGALLLYYHGIEAEFLSFCAGAVFALARLAWHGKLLRVLSNSLFLGLNPVLPRKWRRDISPELMTRMRFGGAILAGTCVAALGSQPF